MRSAAQERLSAGMFNGFTFPPGGGGKAPLPICKQLAQSREMRSECASNTKKQDLASRAQRKKEKRKAEGSKGAKFAEGRKGV